MRSLRPLKLVVPLGLALALVGALTTASAGSASADRLVDAKPSTATPDIKDGAVYAIAHVGDKIVVGGTFTKAADHGSSTTLTRNHILAFDASTGKIDRDFAPDLDKVVYDLLRGPDDHSVYVGGAFKTIDGKNNHALALLDTDTGKPVSGFDNPVLNGSVGTMAKHDGRLLLGGAFTKVSGEHRGGFASVDKRTGKLDSYLDLNVSGHHNYDGAPGQAEGAVGVTAMDVSPDHKTLIAVGNFTKVDGKARDQIVRIDLHASGASVADDWSTSVYEPTCNWKSFDSYVRDVRFSRGGSYFVVVATGGAGSLATTDSHCDAATRFDTDSSGSDVRPAWTAYTGVDSLYAVAVTGAAVYVSGHQRWMNNPGGHDSAGPGAVPRPGIAALDPRTGVPMSWNPGRNPRGVGAKALLATSDGLYVGSDTNYIGNRKYERGKIAYFPLDGGKSVRAEHTGSLPGKVFLAHSDGKAFHRSFDGTKAGAKHNATGAGDWTNVRGAFMVNGTLYYGHTNGHLYRRAFDGKEFGSYSIVDPYDDPAWSDVQTGSGQTYRGKLPSFYAELPDVTGMVYRHGKIYYVLRSKPGLYSRSFSPQSGIVGPDETKVSSKARWQTSGDMFLDGDKLYYSSRTSGNLYKTAWSGGKPNGSIKTVSGPKVDGKGWRNTVLFLLATG